jgi:hypothetical protein
MVTIDEDLLAMPSLYRALVNQADGRTVEARLWGESRSDVELRLQHLHPQAREVLVISLSADWQNEG